MHSRVHRGSFGFICIGGCVRTDRERRPINIYCSCRPKTANESQCQDKTCWSYGKVCPHAEGAGGRSAVEMAFANGGRPFMEVPYLSRLAATDTCAITRSTLPKGV